MSWKVTIKLVHMSSLKILISNLIINILLDDGSNTTVCTFTLKNVSNLP